ncbi:hypothetical protein DNTS_004364 [Danionella cerebrum]|uniref:VWFA domain-containing protein n=1 Tax=Danionella cerebrum TaxID=2873325 RepID=A0A553P945_9TELE|nr:hypothetical protein DNTS_004364 [Danionella translucida]
MDQNLSILCFFCVFQASMSFNVDPESWRFFTNEANSGFGYKVMQKDTRLLVSDPLIQLGSTQRGQIYQCSVSMENCRPLSINVGDEAINMSLGLSMSVDFLSSKALVCGPTIPKNCSVTTYNGMCFKITQNNIVSKSVPRTLRGSLEPHGWSGPLDVSCLKETPAPGEPSQALSLLPGVHIQAAPPWTFIVFSSPLVPRTSDRIMHVLIHCPSSQIDIAFLLDGSSSVHSSDFIKMKTFVIEIIKSFVNQDTQFAITQFSTNCYIHYSFQQVKDPVWWEKAVMGIAQMPGWTNTATAIKLLVDHLFVRSEGARASSSKILVVITDGESSDRHLKEAVQHAEGQSITRYAIGLATIASLPTDKHMFKVTDFDALESIRDQLKENIISIEGTQSSGDSSRMEFAQDGFSSAFISNMDIIMTAVGAYQWKGGYQVFKPNDKPNAFQAGNEHDSYLGYSLAVATVYRVKYAVLGAPRHKHKGRVTVSRVNGMDIKYLDPPEVPQIGSYFGAEVCAVDLNSDSETDLLLVSAPTHIESGYEGKVFVYSITQRFVFSGVVLMGMEGQRGRFGSSLASPADLNGDGFMDVLVGAPLEEESQGSRITGSSVRPGLQYFGISMSLYSPDQSQDDFPDIAVGSKGAVLLLRSRPIMTLQTTVTFNPSRIPTSESEQPLENRIRVCFSMQPHRHSHKDLFAKISFNITLDSERKKCRALFSSKSRFLAEEMIVGTAEECRNHPFLVELSFFLSA